MTADKFAKAIKEAEKIAAKAAGGEMSHGAAVAKVAKAAGVAPNLAERAVERAIERHFVQSGTPGINV